MTSNKIRQEFLEFFKAKEHRIVRSSPVVPYGDPTLLFTNAGMNQFKDVFLGSGIRDYTRAADTQKCIRVSGKHNDLEEVGRDTYHHTFFEMLGNWSFGDYYKKEAIEWAWELLVNKWNLQPERLYATVYKTDDEAFELWKRFLPETRIQRFAEKDNFWEMGETGPCGPCSEIHYDKTKDLSGANLVNAGSADVIEIWNLVFIQYNRMANGELQTLKNKHVDTGMGFERICAVIQGVDSNYDTDIFTPIIEQIETISAKKYSQDLENKEGIAMRVLADHIRTLAFAIADGAIPSNEGRGYVLRRILRRASRFSRELGINKPVLYSLVPTLIKNFGDVFPELKERQNTIENVIHGEEESFLQTLERGLERFESIIAQNPKEISGADSFLLYDSFGFPYDLTELLAKEKGLSVNKTEFDSLMNEQKERSRAARKNIVLESELPDVSFTTEFVGYELNEIESKVLYIKDNLIVLEKTPFYVESGGQVSDTGHIILAGETYNVLDVRKSGNTIFHICVQEIEPLVGSNAFAKIDIERRNDIRKNHSVTHLLHKALEQVLGNHIRQAGSLVAPDYLRFDFNHFEKISKENLNQIEKIVNKKIFEASDVNTNVLTMTEASKISGLKMFFGDKYGDIVRVVSMGNNFSFELCGGTHVNNTIEIGMFKIISESSISAGVRRIEAITGKAVYKFIDELNETIYEQTRNINDLTHKIKKIEKEVFSLKTSQILDSFEQIVQEAIIYNGTKIISKIIPAENQEQLRELADKVRNEMKTAGIALLAAEIDNKAQLVCTVTDDLKAQYPAGKIVGSVAKLLGGGGGGKPHLATAGGKDIAMLEKVINDFPEFIKNLEINN